MIFICFCICDYHTAEYLHNFHGQIRQWLKQEHQPIRKYIYLFFSSEFWKMFAFLLFKQCFGKCLRFCVFKQGFGKCLRFCFLNNVLENVCVFEQGFGKCLRFCFLNHFLENVCVFKQGSPQTVVMRESRDADKAGRKNQF